MGMEGIGTGPLTKGDSPEVLIHAITMAPFGQKAAIPCREAPEGVHAERQSIEP